MTTAIDSPANTNDQTVALERALLAEHVGSAVVVEDAHLSAAEDIAAAAQRQLCYDAEQSSFVNQETGDPTCVRDWLRGQRENRPHWFKVRATQIDPTNPLAPKVETKPAGFQPEAQRPAAPGQPAKDTTAPTGRLMQEMSEQEFAHYKKQNRHARVVSISNVGGRRSCVVDCGSQATAQQAGGQSLDEYRQWRKTQGLGRAVGAR